MQDFQRLGIHGSTFSELNRLGGGTIILAPNLLLHIGALTLHTCSSGFIELRHIVVRPKVREGRRRRGERNLSKTKYVRRHGSTFHSGCSQCCCTCSSTCTNMSSIEAVLLKVRFRDCNDNLH